MIETTYIWIIILKSNIILMDIDFGDVTNDIDRKLKMSCWLFLEEIAPQRSGPRSPFPSEEEYVFLRSKIMY